MVVFRKLFHFLSRMKFIISIIFLLFIILSIFLFSKEKQIFPYDHNKIRVVASFSILGDLIHQIGGKYVDVTTLVGPDKDVHVYEPTPEDAKKLTYAQIVFMNGLNFENWFTRLINSAEYKGPLVQLTKGVKPRLAHKCCQHHAEIDPHSWHDQHKAEIDPHAWHNVENVKIYIEGIKKELTKLDPKHRNYYEANAKEYTKKLDELELWIHNILVKKKDTKHKIITAHAAFGYLEDAYGVSFWSPVGISTDAEPSTRDMIRLINYIKKHGIKIIFIENTSNKKLMEQVQKETGAKIGGVLYSDGLSHKDGPAPDYISMMRHNIGLISQV